MAVIALFSTQKTQFKVPKHVKLYWMLILLKFRNHPNTTLILNIAK